MAQKRVQVADPQGPDTLHPEASPVSVFYTPHIPEPQLAPIIDLSPLSESLQRVKLQQQARANEVARQQGETDAVNPPPNVLEDVTQATAQVDAAEADRKASQDAAAKAVAAGKITEEQNPWYAVGRQQTFARADMAKYADALKSRLSEVSDVIDPQTGLFKNPNSAQQIIADTWQKFSGSAAFQGYYGGKVMSDLKQNIDQSFQSAAAAKLAQAQVELHRQLTSNEVSRVLSEWGDPTMNGDELQSRREGLQKYVQDDMYRLGVKDVRSAFMEGAESAANSLAVSSPGDAANMLRRVKDVVIGTVPVGQDANLSSVINEHIRRFDDQQRIEDERKIHEAPEKLRMDILDAHNYFLPAIVQARESGQNPQAVFDTLVGNARKDSKWGANTEQVLLQTAGLPQQVAAANSGEAQDAIERMLVSSTDPKIIQQTILDSTAAGKLTPETALTLQAKAAQRQNVTTLIEENPVWSQFESTLKAANKIPGASPSQQEDADAALTLRINDLKDRAVQYAGTILSNPDRSNLMRQWVRDNGTPVLTDLQKGTAAKVDTQRQARQEINDLIDHYTDATPAIDKNASLFTEQEVQAMRFRSATQGDRNRLLESSQAFKQGNELIDRAVQTLVGGEEGTSGGARNLADTLSLSQYFRDEFRDKTKAMLAEKIPATKSPNDIPAVMESGVRDITSEMLEKISGTNSGALLNKKIEGGTTTGQALKQKTAVESDRSVAQSVSLPTMSADQAAAQIMRPDRLSPYGSQDVYMVEKLYLAGQPAGWLTGTGNATDAPKGDIQRFFPFDTGNVGNPFISTGRVPGFYNTIRRDQIVDRIAYETDQLNRRSDLSDADRAKAVVSMLSPIGIHYKDILRGTVDVGLSDGTRAAVEKSLEVLKAQSGQTEETRNRMAQLQEILDRPPMQVRLEGAPIGPYTTPIASSLTELKSLSNATLKAVAEKLGVPTDDASMAEFVGRQKQAIRRAFPNGQ